MIIYLKVYSMCLRADREKTLHKLFSDVMKRSRKRAVRIQIGYGGTHMQKTSISGILP